MKKQETLEEASERFTEVWFQNNSFTKELFIEGAKWQAKRMYSEEEVIQLLIIKPNLKNDQEVNQWFEKFKNK